MSSTDERPEGQSFSSRELRDALGRRVRAWPAARAAAEASGQTVSLAGVPAGVYLLTATGSRGQRYVARLVRP